MNLLGLEIKRQTKAAGMLSPVDSLGGWMNLIREPFSGAWQRNIEIRNDTVLTHGAVFRCVSLIASDIAKMRMRLVSQDADGIWVEVENPSYTPVLRKPNRYQNRIQFYENWIQSKLIDGNTYVLKGKDNRSVVNAMYVLDPNRVDVLQADDGDIFYKLSRDNLANNLGDITVPASEIIHDRWNTFFHPLVGLSPIYACGLSAMQGLKIQTNSAHFFANGARPSGIIEAVGKISPEDAQRIRDYWSANYTGENAGKVAVLADGLKYSPQTVAAKDSQLIEQLKWTAENVCTAFGVPPYMAGVGATPLNNNVEALGQQYYSQCLQIHIESIELCLDEGLDLKKPYGTEFDLGDLLRMDTATLVKTEAEAVKGGIKTPNESRKAMNLKPLNGGNSIYMQQQNFSLEALAKRDAGSDPFGTAKPEPAEPPTPADPEDDTEKLIAAITTKGLEILAHV